MVVHLVFGLFFRILAVNRPLDLPRLLHELVEMKQFQRHNLL